MPADVSLSSHDAIYDNGPPPPPDAGEDSRAQHGPLLPNKDSSPHLLILPFTHRHTPLVLRFQAPSETRPVLLLLPLVVSCGGPWWVHGLLPGLFCWRWSARGEGGPTADSAGTAKAKVFVMRTLGWKGRCGWKFPPHLQYVTVVFLQPLQVRG